MEFLKQIQGLIFEPEPKSSQPSQEPQTPKYGDTWLPPNNKLSLPSDQTQFAPQPVIHSQTQFASTSALNPEVEAILNNALTATHQTGVFDYLDFKNLLKNIPSSITDERTRYQSANAMASTMQITPTTLIESANKYLASLQKEETVFQEAMTAKTKNCIEGREEILKTCDAKIQEKSGLINQLTQEINEIANEKEKINNEIVDDKAKIEKSNNTFYATYNHVLNSFKSDIDKITLYLGGTNG